jgi:hypothetical protein
MQNVIPSTFFFFSFFLFQGITLWISMHYQHVWFKAQRLTNHLSFHFAQETTKCKTTILIKFIYIIKQYAIPSLSQAKLV